MNLSGSDVDAMFGPEEPGVPWTLTSRHVHLTVLGLGQLYNRYCSNKHTQSEAGCLRFVFALIVAELRHTQFSCSAAGLWPMISDGSSFVVCELLVVPAAKRRGSPRRRRNEVEA